MSDTSRGYIQELIIEELGVGATFDAAAEIERRVGFLIERMRAAGSSGLVLGISGGVDSSTAGRLCQLAVERVRDEGGDARFLAMRLPYGQQRDEDDAQHALKFVGPDETLAVDVQPASDAMLESVKASGLVFDDPGRLDFVLGNIKARQRMIAQYTAGGARNMLVVGTDQAAEAVMGFYTKFGDGACDLTPLSGLTKRRVRALASELGAADELVGKVPTADLESQKPGLPDEEAFGVTYDEVDDFLEGKPVSARAHETIVAAHRRTAHKRTVPYAVD